MTVEMSDSSDNSSDNNSDSENERNVCFSFFLLSYGVGAAVGAGAWRF